MNGTGISYLETSPENGYTLTDEYLLKGSEYDALIVSNPGNPSGKLMEIQNYRDLLRWCSATDTLLIIDECFMDFVSGEKKDAFQAAHDEFPEAETIRIRSFTKIYAIAGLRIGYALFDDPEKAGTTALYGPPWNVSGPAQKAALAALSDDSDFLFFALG